MARARRPKRKAESPEILAEYRRARAALLRRISRARKKGLNTEEFKVPKIPKRITAGSIRAIKKASEAFTKFIKSIPKSDTIMADLVDRMIQTAELWVDDHPLTHIRERNEERIRHRGREARRFFEDNRLHTDDEARKTVTANIVASWDILVRRLETFLLESDQYKYDGDLAELAAIFGRMLSPIATDNVGGDYDEMIADFVASNGWIDWED